MVQIYDAPKREKSFGERLVGGLSEGVPKAFEEVFSEYKNKQASLNKELSGTQSAMKKTASLYDADKSFLEDEEKVSEWEELTRENIRSGMPKDVASKQALDTLKKKYQEEADIEEAEEAEQQADNPGSFGEAIMQPIKNLNPFDKKKLYENPQQLLEDIKGSASKLGYGAAAAADFAYQLLKAGSDLVPNIPSSVEGFGTPPGQEGKEQEQMSPMELYAEFTGNRHVPEGVAQEILSNAVFGIPVMIQTALEKASDALGLPSWVGQLIGIASFKKTLKPKIARDKLPLIKTELQEVENISKKTGVPPAEILKDAGIDIEKVLAGDAEALSNLKSKVTEVPEVGAKVSAAEKTVYNKKAAARERELFGEKLSETPIEEYHRIDADAAAKESKKTPITKAKEQSIREELQPKRDQAYQSLQHEKDQLIRIKKEKRKATGDDLSRLEALESRQSNRISKIKEQLRDIEHEMKHSRKRVTDAELEAKAADAVERAKDYIENPTPESAAKLKKSIESDRKILEQSKKILDRGEMPGEVRPDTFVRMQKGYLEGYEAGIAKEQGIWDELALTNKKTPAQKNRMKQAEDRVNLYEKRAEVLKGKIVNQMDKIKVMEALDKPSGAFYKQQLKNTRKDLELFQHDLFKKKRGMTSEEVKTKRVASKEKLTPEKKTDQAKPGEKVKLSEEELRKQAGAPKSEGTKAKEKAKEKVKEEKKSRDEKKEKASEKKETTEAKKKVEDGTLNPNDEDKIVRILKNKWVKRTAYGGLIGAADAIWEEITGDRAPGGARSIIKSLAGRTWLVSDARKFVHDMFVDAQIKEMKKRSHNPVLKQRYLDTIRKKYGKNRVNEIKRKMKEERVANAA